MHLPLKTYKQQQVLIDPALIKLTKLIATNSWDTLDKMDRNNETIRDLKLYRTFKRSTHYHRTKHKS